MIRAPTAAGLEHGRKRVLGTIGPGIVFALATVGPGSFVANSAAGATYEYSLIWGLAVTLFFRYVWLEASARYVMATGETLLDGYRRVSRWLVWAILAAVVLVRHFANLYKVVLFGSCLDLLAPLPVPWSQTAWSLVAVGLAFGLMFWGGYPAVERICKTLVVLLGAGLAIAALLARPRLGGILRGALVPTLPEQAGLYSAILLLTALIGTEAGSLTNLSYSYFMYEKGWRDVSYQRRQRLDLLASVGCLFLMGALLQIAAAATVHPLGIRLESIDDLVRIFTRTEGLVGRLIFTLGLLGAVFSAFVGTTTGNALLVTDAVRKLLRTPLKPEQAGDTRRDPIYRWSVLFWCFSPLYVLATNAEPVLLVLLYSSVVVLAIPVLGLALLKITNDRRRMGAHKNGRLANTIIGLLILLSIVFTAQNGVGWWGRLWGGGR